MKQPDNKENPAAPILALDLGQKRVGVAVSDRLAISITKLPPLDRTNWKQLLSDVSDLCRRFDVRTLVIGLPLSLEGTSGTAAMEARDAAEKFARSLKVAVYLQDERLTSVEAEEQLRSAGFSAREIPALVDGQAAAIILADFIAGGQRRLLVSLL
ncbi:MAG: Holliday junction resolvase RuvX [Pyrinomonadaceae bacterium]